MLPTRHHPVMVCKGKPLPGNSWAISNRMKRDLAIRVLDMAVALRQPPKGFIHHMDRGSQYCSGDYRKRLSKHEFKISMSGRGDCYDNYLLGRFTI